MRRSTADLAHTLLFKPSTGCLLTRVPLKVPMQDNKGRINSIDFHRTHDFLVAGHDAGCISIYSTFEGRKLTMLDCSKYGVAHVAFTHHPKCILHASSMVRSPRCDSRRGAGLMCAT